MNFAVKVNLTPLQTFYKYLTEQWPGFCMLNTDVQKALNAVPGANASEAGTEVGQLRVRQIGRFGADSVGQLVWQVKNGGKPVPVPVHVRVRKKGDVVELVAWGDDALRS